MGIKIIVCSWDKLGHKQRETKKKKKTTTTTLTAICKQLEAKKRKEKK